MNYRERMKEYLKEPDENSPDWGRWGILNKEQRTLIKRLLNEMDSADEVIKHQYFETERLQSKNKKIQTILRTRARQDRKRKAKLRKLRLETTNQRLKLERLNNIIKEVREDLYQIVKWCTENKHNEDTIKRYLVVDYGTLVGKINEIRTKLDKEVIKNEIV